MADQVLERVSPWMGALDAGTHGAADTDAPVVIAGQTALSSVSVLARRGASVPAIMGIAMPNTGKWVANDKVRVAADGPDQWRVVGRGFAEGELFTAVKEAVGSQASVIDQSHGWATVVASGEMMPDVLAKGTSLDTHLDVFGAGDCAVTQVGHMSVHVTCLDDDGPTYVFQMFRSMAGSFAEWLKDSAAPYGVRIE